MKTSHFLLLLFISSLTACQNVNKKALLDINHPEVNQKAPEKFKVEFHTSKGLFVVDVTRKWAPKGADRMYNLVNHG